MAATSGTGGGTSQAGSAMTLAPWTRASSIAQRRANFEASEPSSPTTIFCTRRTINRRHSFGRLAFADERVRAALMLAGQAGMLPAHALAHGTISPTSARHGSTQSFVVVVPNISVNVPLTGFRLTPPEGVDVEAEEDPDWSTTTEGGTPGGAGGGGARGG